MKLNKTIISIIFLSVFSMVSVADEKKIESKKY